MALDRLKPPAGAVKTKKRLGRGDGSGLGKTCGKGHKGLKARSGGGVRPGFEGGQMPLQRRLPKRGFHNVHGKTFAIVNLKDLNRFESGREIDEKALREAGLVKGRCDGVKILGQGEINVALKIKIDKVSAAAKDKIEAAGGTIEVV